MKTALTNNDKRNISHFPFVKVVPHVLPSLVKGVKDVFEIWHFGDDWFEEFGVLLHFVVFAGLSDAANADLGLAAQFLGETFAFVF